MELGELASALLGYEPSFLCLRKKLSRVSHALKSTLGFTVGALWEVFEWSTSIGREGLSDTITDLIVDGGGALAAALVALLVSERGERLT